MPMHDWSRVTAGTYHNFHYHWLAMISNRLNAGILPEGWFAMAEQRIAGPEADVLTLSQPGTERNGGTATLAPPQAALVERAERLRYARRTNRLAIQHALGEVAAVLELISPGNKDTRAALRSFARKSADLIRQGIHLSIVDPFPPGRHDRHGIHRAIWEHVTQEASAFEPSAECPLTLVAYQAGPVPTAYVEPFALGAALPDLPLFLEDDFYVQVPLEETYQATWNVLPQVLRNVVTNAASPRS